MDKLVIGFEKFRSLITSERRIENLIVIYDGNIEELKTTYLKNIQFKKHINFNKTILNGFVLFEDCQFEAGISFTSNSFLEGIEFKNCKGTEVIFKSCGFSYLSIIGGEYQKINFNHAIKEITETNNTIELNKTICKEFLIDVKEASADLIISGAEIEMVSILARNILGDLSIKEDSIINYLSSQSCTFHSRIDLANSNIQHIWFHKCNFDEQVLFTAGLKCKMLTLGNITAKQNVTLDFASNVKNLLISDSNINFTCSSSVKDPFDSALSCDISGVINGNLVFTDIPISDITIGAINFGNIIFEGIQTKFITFNNFHNRNRLSISNIKLDSSFNALIVSDSNVNLTEFINIDFRKFNEVVIGKSEVSNIILSNSRLPKELQIETKEPKLGYLIDETWKENSNLYFREAYRQLKVVMDKHGNRKEALHFFSKEMYYLRKESKFEWDGILLFLNYISNNFGTSWIRGIQFTVSISFLFFCLYNEASGHPFFFWNLTANREDVGAAFLSGFNGFTSYWTTFPNLKFNDVTNTGWQLNLVIFFSRIFIGYGIYQTITAFRKFGR